MRQLWSSIPLLTLALSSSLQAEESIEFPMCYENRQLLPYFTGDGSEVPKTQPGVSIEALQRFDILFPDIHITFRREPWKRCLALLQDGSVAGVIASYKEERQAFGVYPMKDNRPDPARAFEITSYCLFTKKQQTQLQWDGANFTQDHPLPVAIPLGYSINDLFRNNGLETIGVNSSDQGFFLLHNGRVSATATLCQPGRLILAEHDEYNDLEASPYPLRTKGSYLLISRHFYNTYPALSEKIWDVMAQTNEKYYQIIYQRYVTH